MSESETFIQTIHPEYPNNYFINVINRKGNANKEYRIFENTPVLGHKFGIDNVYTHQADDNRIVQPEIGCRISNIMKIKALNKPE